MRKADNLPPSCAVVTKSGNPNFLEPSGPVQACSETALPSPLHTQLHHFYLRRGRVIILHTGIYFQIRNTSLLEVKVAFYSFHVCDFDVVTI